ncbi:hypothetical protein PPTG_10807 [Phytophthora nicotianae INRA-310]|uniref:Uncharacterized protein n=1 Tax=Phytophthora nicotianae (strain INRA-310) TaxID=761204 RepID=W2QA69_PHYN3|nr:hypothetical protein PPTG_10807 [Phytophthora nicotianae INRA-310]ETN10073.1 hypothetical protein PPTG_10807 [Phytophthora nicotianae INRA-310]
MASRSLLREGKETDSYYMMFDSSDEEEEGAIAEPQEITNGIYRQQDLFQAAQRKPGESFGTGLFLSELKAPRGLIGGPHF